MAELPARAAGPAAPPPRRLPSCLPSRISKSRCRRDAASSSNHCAIILPLLLHLDTSLPPPKKNQPVVSRSVSHARLSQHSVFFPLSQSKHHPRLQPRRDAQLWDLQPRRDAQLWALQPSPFIPGGSAPTAWPAEGQGKRDTPAETPKSPPEPSRVHIRDHPGAFEPLMEELSAPARQPTARSRGYSQPPGTGSGCSVGRARAVACRAHG